MPKKHGRPLDDMTGRRFERLLVLERIGAGYNPVKWRCRCDCGNHTITESGHLRGGTAKSCGCWRRDRMARLNAEGEFGRYFPRTHGASGTPLHNCWARMIGRCKNANSKNFKDYGGRGIHVCQRWRESFEAFRDDMGERPSQQHSIDRIDTNGHYEPGNCRWATPSVQGNNQRTNRRIVWNGESRTIAEWGRHIGIGHSGLSRRLMAGWSVERALTTPADIGNRGKRGKALLSHNGQTLTLAEWTRRTGLKRTTIGQRLRHGWSIERALTTP